ncbi:MAG: metal ABC transporter substrate-binding protein [Mariprofundaceae bacterium]
MIFLSGILFTAADSSVAHSAEIVVTIPPIAGIVQMLDKENKVTCLLPSGSDPHHFQLSPRQIEKLQQATLLVRTSKDDHGWLKLSSDIPAIDLWPNQSHAWLNPDHVQAILPRLAEKLISLAPKKRALILKNLKVAQKRTGLVNAELAYALKGLKTDGIMMQHPSWRSLFKRFDIPVLTSLESQHHGHELTPRHLEEALSILKKNPDAVLIGSLRHSNRSLVWLSNHAGNKKEILYLDALGSCDHDWPTLMQQNIARIKNR